MNSRFGRTFYDALFPRGRSEPVRGLTPVNHCCRTCGQPTISNTPLCHCCSQQNMQKAGEKGDQT